MLASEQTVRVCDLMQQQGVDVRWLALETGLDERIIDAIRRQQYTPSPQQRAYVAQALRVDPEDILWGHAIEAEYLKDPI